MGFGIRATSKQNRTCLILVVCVFAMFLLYLKSSFNEMEDLSKVVKQNSDSSKAEPPDPDSPNLKPPTQEWMYNQLYKTISFLNWKYVPPNDWEKCTPRTYFFPHINTVFTGIPKTGCSNWLIALLGAEGELNKKVDPSELDWVHKAATDRHRIVNIVKHYDRSDLEKAFSFTVVRNPWTRMVSGYRQKLSSEKTQGDPLRWIRTKIVIEMRGIFGLLFDGIYPTFEEYVRYLIKRSGQVNSHFTQQTNELCIPDAMYDYILPLEHASSLSKEVWSRINGTHPALLGSYDKTSDPRLQSSTLYAKKWLSELDPELIEQLYSIYKGDFILMNYSNFTHPDFPLPLHSSPTN